MSDERFRYALSEHLLPILCGNTRQAHRLSAQIWQRLGTSTLICGKPRLWDLFDPSSHTLRLPKSPSPRLLCEILIDLADAYPECLPVLIPCSAQARSFVEDYGALLETRYLLCDATRFFSQFPIVSPA
jgi:hypothetical protein